MSTGGAAMRPTFLPWFTLSRKGDCITLMLGDRRTLNLTPLMAQELAAELTHFIEEAEEETRSHDHPSE